MSTHREDAFADPILAAEGPAPAESSDDMRDTKAERQQYFPLPLQLCADAITGAFMKADSASKSHQKWHTRLAFLTVMTGTLAVLVAILELGYHDAVAEILGQYKEIPGRLELALALASFAFFAFGKIAHFKERWLWTRHQAERYRLLKFQFLIQPHLWNPEADSSDWLGAKAAEIGALRRDHLDEEAEQPLPHGPFKIVERRVDRAVVRSLVDYYRKKRLEPQKNYLANRAQRNEFRDRLHYLLPAFFFGSVLAVLLQFLWNWKFGWDWRNWQGHLLTTFCAAMFPVLAAAFRTWRAAFEYSRNKSRFRAARASLDDLEGRLLEDQLRCLEGHPTNDSSHNSVILIDRERRAGGDTITGVSFELQNDLKSPPAAESGGSADLVEAYDVFRALWWCEHILETEHREWLRLMLETEWYG